MKGLSAAGILLLLALSQSLPVEEVAERTEEVAEPDSDKFGVQGLQSQKEVVDVDDHLILKVQHFLGWLICLKQIQKFPNGKALTIGDSRSPDPVKKIAMSVPGDSTVMQFAHYFPSTVWERYVPDTADVHDPTGAPLLQLKFAALSGDGDTSIWKTEEAYDKNMENVLRKKIYAFEENEATINEKYITDLAGEVINDNYGTSTSLPNEALSYFKALEANKAKEAENLLSKLTDQCEEYIRTPYTHTMKGGEVLYKDTHTIVGDLIKTYDGLAYKEKIKPVQTPIPLKLDNPIPTLPMKQ